MSVLTQTIFGSETMGARIAAFRSHMAEQAAKRRVFRTTYNELQSLTDRDLNDLGLHRSEITRIARDAAYGN